MKFLLIPFLILLCFSNSLTAQDITDTDLSKLKSTAQTFVDAFNEGDAKAVADLFVSDGEIVLVSGDLLIGRDNLLEHYTEVFSAEERPQAALETTSIRFIASQLASADGTFHLTHPNGEISSHHFTSVHIKQEDGNWLYASVRDQEGDHALPSEKLIALQWLIGDWLIQTENGDTWITFDWSKDGPFIDARALTESAGLRSTAATLRIGWNERSETFNSWGFDGAGGFSHSTWSSVEPDHWMLKTNGVTSDGETNSTTQSIALDSSKESFTWTKRDQLINSELQPERTLKAVKRPPAPLSATSEIK
tara:strand:- start:868 stop:1788 length:921 start_codon:yes stop_codon:yes gene_type:complete